MYAFLCLYFDSMLILSINIFVELEFFLYFTLDFHFKHFHFVKIYVIIFLVNIFFTENLHLETSPSQTIYKSQSVFFKIILPWFGIVSLVFKKRNAVLIYTGPQLNYGYSSFFS